MKNLFLLHALFCFSTFASPLVTLTIKEDAGSARLSENVTTGVPIPADLNISESSFFFLSNEAGTPLPCRFTVTARHSGPKEAIRWLRLDFPLSIDANGSRTLILNSGTAAQPPLATLVVSDLDTVYIINTGLVFFEIRKKNFNIFNRVFIDETGSGNFTDSNCVLKPHGLGITQYGPAGSFLSGLDTASRVIIEKSDPYMACIKATGYLRNATGQPGLYYVARLYAFAGSATVRAQVSIECHAEIITTPITVQGIEIELPLALGPSRNALFGTPGGFASKILNAEAPMASVIVKRPGGVSDHSGIAVQYTGVTAATINPKTNKPRDIGWVSLSDGNRGLAVSLRWFWQMLPASLEADTSSRIRVCFFSRSALMPALDIYPGVARTFNLSFSFFNKALPEVQRSLSMAGCRPLIALAPPAWYTRRTAGFGRLTNYDSLLFAPADLASVSNWNTQLNARWNATLPLDDAALGTDAYGFLEWGDNPHYSYSGPAPYNVWPWLLLWNGNYYGLDQMAFHRFVTTGNRVMLDYALSHAAHVQDVHNCHFGPNDPRTGGNRYCPPANHVATDDKPPQITADNPSHHKVEAQFSDYYLTGNDRALDVALNGVRAMKGKGITFAYAPGAPSDNLTTYIRRWSHQMMTLLLGYELTQSDSLLRVLWMNWQCIKSDIERFPESIGQNFMVGLCMETLVKMYWTLPDSISDSIPPVLKRLCDVKRYSGLNAGAAVGYAFLSRFYGAGYKSAALSLGNSGLGTNHKGFAIAGRSLEQAAYYFALKDSLYSDKTVISIENKPESFFTETVLSAHPNPFNPLVNIRLHGLAKEKHAYVKIALFAFDGTLIRDFTPIYMSSPEKNIPFSAHSLASGLYLVRASWPGGSLKKQILLLK